MAEWIFLDHYARTRPSKKLIEEMGRLQLQHWMELGEKKGAVKQELCEAIGAQDHSLYLSSGSSEGSFQVLFAHYADSIRESGRTHILTLETECSPIAKTIKTLEKFEVKGKALPVNAQGQLTRQALTEAVRPRSSMLSFSLAHPLTGVIQPAADLIEVCREHEIRVHLDIGSALGKFAFWTCLFDADFFTFDGALLHLPEGIGGITVKEGGLTPTLRKTLKEGSLAQVSGLLLGVQAAQEQIDHYAMEVARLRDIFEEKMSSLAATLFFQEVDRLANCSVIAFEGVHSEQLLFHLERKGVFATTGEGALAHVMKACGVRGSLAHAAVSFILSDETTEEEVLRTCAVIEEVLKEELAHVL
ncbi:MAG: Cysteine desulfurase IscS [Chlamydiae bacterium]|nr:Cysteine desulfurase IscS [Chlamydiota bacterium]